MTLIEQLETTGRALNVQEVADLLGISKQHVYEMVADGSIPAFHVGRSIRFDPQELADWLRRIKPHTGHSGKGHPKTHDDSKSSSREEAASEHRIWRKRFRHLEVAAAGE